MAYIEVDLKAFDEDELIDEIEDRGLYVYKNEPLTSEEKGVILDMLANAKPGTIEYDIYEKLRKR